MSPCQRVARILWRMTEGAAARRVRSKVGPATPRRLSADSEEAGFDGVVLDLPDLPTGRYTVELLTPSSATRVNTVG